MTSPAADVGHGVRPPGYRLPDATRIGMVRLQVADLDRSLGYYERVLGLKTLSREGTEAVLGTHGDEPILELHAKAGATPVPRRGRLGLYHFAILLPDRPALGRFLAHLGEIGEYAGMSDHLVSEALYLTDPDGLGIEVYADRPRAQWRYEGRELTMGILPLNAPDVVAAAGGERWSGMPNGTTMGHVHLYVGNLEEAASFYHDALGFDKIVWGYQGALFMSAGGYHHHLGTNTWAAGAPVSGPDDARLLEWELVLPDAESVGKAAESLERSGNRLERAPDGSVLARDGWNTGVRLVSFRAQ